MEVGDQVLRKGTSPLIGIVRVVSLTHARVDWPAPRRINGRGYHRSDVKLSSLVLATPEVIALRVAETKAKRHAERVCADHARIFTCLNVHGVNHGGHVLTLLPSQVRNGQCHYCSGAVIMRESLF